MLIQQRETELWLVVDSDLIFTTYRQTQQALSEALSLQPPGKIVIDLSQIDQIDSRGLKVLVDAYKQAQQHQHAIRIHLGHKAGLYLLLKRCHMDQFISLHLNAEGIELLTSQQSASKKALSNPTPDGMTRGGQAMKGPKHGFLKRRCS
jgi:anti-anti-sigma factor